MKSFGTYLLNRKDQARFLVLDADDTHGLKRLVNLASNIKKGNIPAYVENSRRGGHLWIFLSNPTPGCYARDFAKSIMDFFEVNDLEIFPKQDQLRKEPGSLIRLPFGIHRLTGRRYGFLKSDVRFLVPTIRDQIYILSAPETVPKVVFDNFRSRIPKENISASYVSTGEKTDMVSDRIKKSISVLEFVSQHVDLKPTNNGAIGLCPFHNDHHPSSGINDKANYWHCLPDVEGGRLLIFG